MGVEPRADGRSALSEGKQPRQGCFNALDSEVDLGRVSREFLPERYRRGVLQMRAPDLHYIGEVRCLSIERLVQVPQRRQQPLAGLAGGGDVHGGWEAV